MQTRAARPGWESLPEPVRKGVEQLLGSPVVAAVSQPDVILRWLGERWLDERWS